MKSSIACASALVVLRFFAPWSATAQSVRISEPVGARISSPLLGHAETQSSQQVLPALGFTATPTAPLVSPAASNVAARVSPSPLPAIPAARLRAITAAPLPAITAAQAPASATPFSSIRNALTPALEAAQRIDPNDLAYARAAGSDISDIMTSADGPPSDQELLQLSERNSRFYEELFPRFHKRFPLSLGWSPSRDPGGEHRAYQDGKHSILLESDRFPRNEKKDARIEYHGQTYGWDIWSLIVVFHEYAHGIFYEAAVPLSSRLPEGAEPQFHYNTAFDTLNEGFAVTMELLFVDKLIAGSDHFKLSARDTQDLSTWKQSRLSRLATSKDYYSQGTLNFWLKIYEKEGEAGMAAFLSSLDYERLRLPPWNPAYWLVQESPALFKAVFARQGDVDVRYGLEIILSFAYGQNRLSALEKKIAAWFLNQVPTSAVERTIVNYLALWSWGVSSAARDDSKPFMTLDPLFRIARLDERFTPKMIEFFTTPSESLSTMCAHLRYSPLYSQQLLERTQSLPMTIDQRAYLRAKLLAVAAASR